MNILSEIKTIFGPLNIRVETGSCSEALEEYIVLMLDIVAQLLTQKQE